MNSSAIGQCRTALISLIAGVSGVVTPVLGQVVHEQQKLLAEDGQLGDNFGWAIAEDNGIIAIGAKLDDDSASQAGSAYLFNTSNGNQILKLLPNDGARAEQFGASIDIQDDIVAVGAIWDDDNGLAAGSAYLFDVKTGAQLHKLLPNDGSFADNFGNSISIDNGIVAVGASSSNVHGAVYLFDIATGTQLAKITPNDGANSDIFGWSVDLQDGILAVGSHLHDGAGTDAGAVYLFDATSFEQLAKIVPDDTSPGEMFGGSIAMDDGVLAVGARRDNDNGMWSGSAYLFDVHTGAQFAKLLAHDGQSDDYFGSRLAIKDGLVAVRASTDDHGALSGAVYIFDAKTGEQIIKLLPSDGAESDRFGSSLALNGNTVVVGAYHDDNSEGSVYVFNISCPIDMTNDGDIDFFDISAFLEAFQINDPLADLTNDGVYNFFDVSAFLIAFSAGCS